MKLLDIASAVLAPAFAVALLCCAPALAQDKAVLDKAAQGKVVVDKAVVDKNKVEFARVQSECVQSADITFGPQGRWASCRVTRAGFVATIGLQDFYYAHYCLANKAGNTTTTTTGTTTTNTTGGCDRQAQVVFRNRAYRPEAFVDMVRIDPPGTGYDIPLLIGSDTESALVTGVRFSDQSEAERSYFIRRQDRWEPIEARAWLRHLPERLPAGLSVRAQSAQSALPDPTTMVVRMPLFVAADRDCCATGGSVEVQLSIEGGVFQVLDLNLLLAKGAK